MTTPTYYKKLAEIFRAQAIGAKGKPQVASRCNRLATEYEMLAASIEEIEERAPVKQGAGVSPAYQPRPR